MLSPFAPQVPSAQGGKMKSKRGWLGWMQPGVQALEDEYNRVYGGAVPRMADQLFPNLGPLWATGAGLLGNVRTSLPWSHLKTGGGIGEGNMAQQLARDSLQARSAATQSAFIEQEAAERAAALLAKRRTEQSIAQAGGRPSMRPGGGPLGGRVAATRGAVPPAMPPPYRPNFTITEPGGPLVPTAGRNAMVPYRGTLPAVQRGPGISGPGYGAEAWTMSGAAGPAASGLSRFLGGAGRLAGRAIWPALIGKGLYDTYRTEMEGGPGTIKSYLKPYDPSDEAALAAQQEAIFGPAGSFPPIPQTQATPPSGRASGPFAPFLADRAQQAMPGGPKPRPHITERAAKVSGALTSAMKALAPPQAGEADLPGRAEALEAVSRALGGFMAPTPATPRTEANRGAQDQDVNWMQKAQMATPMPPEEVAALQQQYGQGPLLAQPAGYNYNPAMAGAIGRYGTSSRAIASPLTALESQPLDPNRPRLPIANLGVMSPEVARQRVEDREYEALMAAQRPERFYGAQTSYQNELDKVFGRAPGGGELPEGVPPREGFVANLRDRQSVAEEIARRRMIQDYTSQPRGTTMVGRVGTPATAEMLAAAALRPSRQERVAANRQRRRDALRGLTPGQAEAERTMMAGVGASNQFARDATMFGTETALALQQFRTQENVARAQMPDIRTGSLMAELESLNTELGSGQITPIRAEEIRTRQAGIYRELARDPGGPIPSAALQVGSALTPLGADATPFAPSPVLANPFRNPSTPDIVAAKSILGNILATDQNMTRETFFAKATEAGVSPTLARQYADLYRVDPALPWGPLGLSALRRGWQNIWDTPSGSADWLRGSPR